MTPEVIAAIATAATSVIGAVAGLVIALRAKNTANLAQDNAEEAHSRIDGHAAWHVYDASPKGETIAPDNSSEAPTA